MKKIVLAFICLFISCSVVYAADDGCAWNELSYRQKQQMISTLRNIVAKDYRGMRSVDYYINEMDAFFDTGDPNALSSGIGEAFTFVVEKGGTQPKQK